MTIDLSDIIAAMQNQNDLMNSGILGEYFPTTNSCLPHIVNILEAGGEIIGKRGRALKEFTRKYGFKQLF